MSLSMVQRRVVLFLLAAASALSACSSSGGNVCEPGAKVACAYTGPAGTEGKGACVAGSKACLADGSGFGACEGEVVPAEESCATAVDDDCDGTVNETDAGCVCVPGAEEACYEGPSGTSGVGLCVAGKKHCADDGKSFGACVGQVHPVTETCATSGDDDCDGLVNEDGAGCGCTPGSEVDCYSGPANTRDVGSCRAGVQTCLPEGTGFGECKGEVLPAAESCLTPEDEDCDGLVNEEGQGCVCVPQSTTSCYEGPAGTAGVGACRTGTMTCDASGTSYGACTGGVVPVAESCGNGVDDDCDGAIDEGCGFGYASDVQPIFAKYCASCHGSGSFTTSYTASQASSGRCSGETVGACALDRIANGTMPPSVNCSSNFNGTQCPTQQERTKIQDWIDGGQKP